jgi:hypothetical protein
VMWTFTTGFGPPSIIFWFSSSEPAVKVSHRWFTQIRWWWGRRWWGRQWCPFLYTSGVHIWSKECLICYNKW